MPTIILTNTGQSKLAAASAGGDPVVITHMAVGDGNWTPGVEAYHTGNTGTAGQAVITSETT